MESEIGMFRNEVQASIIKEKFEQYLNEIDQVAKRNGKTGHLAIWYPKYFLEMGKDLKNLDDKYSYLKDNFFEYNSEDYMNIFKKITNLYDDEISRIIKGGKLKNKEEFRELNNKFMKLQNEKRSSPDKPKAEHNIGGIPNLGTLMRKLLQFHFNKEISPPIIIEQNFPLNQILYGPPGTGKTYYTINKALAIIYGEDFIEGKRREELKEEFEKLSKEKQIVFITFHQSMSYEDFIEGLKPKLDGSNINYEIKPGIFKKICVDAEEDLENKYVLIIDEINRGNVSQIFGELITLIEEDKRLDKIEELKATLPYSGKEFGVPDNLYIIGTMNTADRSVEALDTALRRRFSFIEMLPEPKLLDPEKLKIDIQGINLRLLLETINDRIEKLLDREHQIGHSYFLGVKNLEDLKQIFKNKIIPLLQEYFFGDYGKIGLVLGENFFKEEQSVSFKKFKDYDDSDFNEKKIYRLKDALELTDNDFKSIYE
jgi:5-methylcytosine-specific restriction endonuclease McrBC GTP-binding regulatory subunit McrB